MTMDYGSGIGLQVWTNTKNRLSSDSVSAILTTANGETLVGTFGGGLNIISDLGEVIYKILAAKRVILLHQSKDGPVWIGTESGLYKFDQKTRSLIEIETGREASTASANPIFWRVAEAQNGDIWLGTMHNGLFFWPREFALQNDTSELKQVTKATSRIGPIYAIEIDNLGFPWCSTNSGLIRINPSTKQSTLVSTKYGIQNHKFDFAVSHKDSQGLLYFGGSTGYTKFNPSLFSINFSPSPLRFTKVVFAESTRLKQVNSILFNHLQLTHKNYFVTFEFSVLDFIDPENNQFRYKLENFDPEWIENGKRNTATYTNLPAGEYTFSVQGANSAGVWNREGISMQVTVLPAPWFTWWAYVFYLFIFGIIVWLGKGKYDSYTIGRLARDMAIEMRENEERAYDDIQEHQDLHDDLVTVAHQHNVQTLALINNFIVQQQQYLSEPLSLESSEKCSRIISSLSALENCLLYQGDGLVADLRKLTDSIFSDLLEQSPVDPGSIITINDVTSDMVPAELASLLAVFIHEAVENAFVHAFDESSPANYVQVSLAVTPRGNNDFQDTYSLTISDSGIGIPIHLRPETSDTQGLGMMQAIATRLNGSLQISVNEGTQVSLSIPITMQL